MGVGYVERSMLTCVTAQLTFVTWVWVRVYCSDVPVVDVLLTCLTCTTDVTSLRFCWVGDGDVNVAC